MCTREPFPSRVYRCLVCTKENEQNEWMSLSPFDSALGFSSSSVSAKISNGHNSSARPKRPTGRLPHIAVKDSPPESNKETNGKDKGKDSIPAPACLSKYLDRIQTTEAHFLTSTKRIDRK